MTWNQVISLAKAGNLAPEIKIVKSDAEWQDQLTPEQYNITRQHGTERPWSGAYCHAFEPGLFACVCCQTPLFDSSEKFDSGTGWPSFSVPVKASAIQYHLDTSFGMTRVEVCCNCCDAHLGHVFPDGPPPTGLRYCINAVALQKL
jgi:peptide-methionine (R)-S-oxide reductase